MRQGLQHGGEVGNGRLSGVDALRAAALLAVIYIHAPKSGQAALFVEQLARFAVPYFFAAAGYFLSTGPIGSAARRSLVRIGAPFLFWLLFYNLLPEAHRVIEQGGFDHNRGTLIVLLLGGAGYHLWFLPSLLFCTLMLLPLRRAPAPLLAALALVLYAAGLALGAYDKALWGSDIPWSTVHGPTFGFAFLTAGFLIRRHGLRPGWGPSLAILLGGLALQSLEYAALGYETLTQRDFVMGTLPFGVGILLLALTVSPTPWLAAPAAVGRVSLGLYCLHLFVLETLLRVWEPTSLPGILALALSVFLICVAAIVPLSRIPGVRRLVA